MQDHAQGKSRTVTLHEENSCNLINFLQFNPFLRVMIVTNIQNFRHFRSCTHKL